ncbi:MAG: DUF948 domain-containing protein [Oscillatoriaceae bacterium SKW80]|nr:DUF948 domain-containing protein [Oscillatoriaceae bacterium SKYG93]MCX8121923.1 DUF948 domain-containing protein [Oscillatoriaceae bacterium SKW80]MDW8451881.1 DUF948 domain-containing protein [Oscillatoriaceae cyanobacterium SKYGB_i_bin93]
MIDPLFWLGLSILLVAVSLTAVLVAALPALHEIARAARSVEKLADTLRRELPPTLEAIRLTGMEISDLTDDINEGVNSATEIVKQVDRSLDSAKQQAKKVQVTTKSIFTGLKAAWKTFTRPSSSNSSSSSSNSSNDSPRRTNGRVSASQRMSLESRDYHNSPEITHSTDNLNNHHVTSPTHSQNLTRSNFGK